MFKAYLWNIYMLNDQATVMMVVKNFTEIVVHYDISKVEFIQELNKLIPAFKAFESAGMEYSPMLQSFALLVQAIDCDRGEAAIASYLQDLSHDQILKLKRILTSPRTLYSSEVRQFKEQESRNQKSFCGYVNSIIHDHHKVLFVRVDLGYLKEKMPNITVADFYQHIEAMCRLLKDKNGCFKYLLGYGLALEQGETKGYHAHLLLIYNGSKRQNDWYLADETLKKWMEITQPMGYGMNGNTTERKEHFSDRGLLGIGMIHRANEKEVRNALVVANYLVHPEKYVQKLLLKPSGKRTFYKGVYREHGRHYQSVQVYNKDEGGVGVWGSRDTAFLWDDE